jgi:hypothetical protein
MTNAGAHIRHAGQIFCRRSLVNARLRKNSVDKPFVKGFAERLSASEQILRLHGLATMPVCAALTVPQLALFDSLGSKYSDPNS